MSDTIRIGYTFGFEKDETIEIDLHLDPVTLESKAWRTVSAPAWADLTFEQCSNCPLEPGESQYCPLALRLLQLVQSFGRHMASEEVDLKVETLERTYLAHTTLQEAIRSLVGVLMPLSGCPHLAPFRPMARFHLPIGSVAETIYRAASMYLLAQYFVAQKGGEPDWQMSGLGQLYRDIHEVNVGITKRLAKAGARDAAVESLTRLDLFTSEVPHSIDEHMAEFAGYFHSYI